MTVRSDRFGSPHPFRVCLYSDTNVRNLDLPEIAEYLDEQGLFDGVELRGPFLKEWGDREDIAKKLAETRVHDPDTMDMRFDPTDSEIEFEKEQIRNSEGEMTSVMYDGFRLGKVYTDLIPEEERGESFLHIIFTSRFFGTWKPATQRYHARVSVYGLPSIISTTGIADAPAKPPGYYRVEWSGDVGGNVNANIIRDKEGVRGEFVDYDDERLTEIMKGYSMHAVFYHLGFHPFCDDVNCRLYNPHLQKNILNAQLTAPEFCEKHRKILKEFRGNLA